MVPISWFSFTVISAPLLFVWEKRSWIWNNKKISIDNCTKILLSWGSNSNTHGGTGNHFDIFTNDNFNLTQVYTSDPSFQKTSFECYNILKDN